MCALSTRALRIAAGIAPAVVLLAVSLWEAWAARADATDVPDATAWAAAEKRVRAEFRAGDLIEDEPAWIDPLVRERLGDLMPVRDVARMDEAKYVRIWRVARRGSHVDVSLHEQTPVHVLADVRDLIGGAKIEGGGAPHRELAEVGFAPHDCIEVTPMPKQTVRITFPSVPLGSRLVGYVGLADVFTRRDIREPGRLVVEIGGQNVATVVPGVDDGWVRFEAATQPGARDVTFAISADAPSRLVCFAAEARE